MVIASITFTQGAASPGPGISMVGVGGVLVTLTNADDTGVVDWDWELLDSPLNSALIPAGLGTAASESFTPDTPDTPGCYRIKLTTQGADGSVACDVKNFAVPTTQGWILPPFKATAAELNFPGNTEGWESLLNTIFLEMSTGGTGENVKVSETDTVAGRLSEKVAAGTNVSLTILNPGGDEELQISANVAGASAFRDEFAATAGQTLFTLSQTPTAPSSVTLSVNGVIYDDVSDYILVANSVTWLNTLFSLDVGDKIIISYW